jgi:hypothetical protein
VLATADTCISECAAIVCNNSADSHAADSGREMSQG